MLAVSSLDVAPTIREAITAGAAVVALESAVITHGLPKAAAMEAVARQWDACTKQGARPAVVAVFDGRLRVGLSMEECVSLADRADAVKVSPWNLGAALVTPGFGGTTVAATIAGAAKAGIAAMTVITSLELGRYGVRVNAIAPGIVRTQLARALWESYEDRLREQLPLGRIGEPEDIASVAVFLAGSASAWMTGQTLVVDGGAIARPSLI